MITPPQDCFPSALKRTAQTGALDIAGGPQSARLADGVYRARGRNCGGAGGASPGAAKAHTGSASVTSDLVFLAARV